MSGSVGSGFGGAIGASMGCLFMIGALVVILLVLAGSCTSAVLR